MQLTQGKGPSWTVDSGRNPVCFVPFLGEQKGSELSECMSVSSPVTNAVGCFDFTRWTGDFLPTLNKSHNIGLGSREFAFPVFMLRSHQ